MNRRLVGLLLLLSTVASARSLSNSTPSVGSHESRPPLDLKSDRPVRAPEAPPPRLLSTELAADPDAKKNAGVLGKTNIPADEGVDLQMSVLSEEYVQQLFKQLADDPGIPHAYSAEGCFARAHAMARAMEKQHVRSGKYFLTAKDTFRIPGSNDVNAGWFYHVAPIVYVRVGKVNRPYILDPALFKKAVPLGEWTDKVSDGKPRDIEESYLTSRYHYKARDRGEKRTEFAEPDIDDMEDTLKRHLDVLERRKKDPNAEELRPLGPAKIQGDI